MPWIGDTTKRKDFELAYEIGIVEILADLENYVKDKRNNRKRYGRDNSKKFILSKIKEYDIL